MPLSFRPVEEILDAQGWNICSLDAETIDVWGWTLDGSQGCEDRCRQYLSDEERVRAGRFLRDEDRQRYIFAHGSLRVLVGRYMNVEPGALVFQRGMAGKPVLCEKTHGSDVVVFNMSHAHDRALIALSRHREIGVDLELIRVNANATGLADRYYAPAERVAISEAQEADRAATFFRYWVAKEAVLKAQGIGLRALSQCEILMAADGVGAEVQVPVGSPLQDKWRIRFLSCGEGWEAAVAAQGVDWVAQCGLAGC